MLKITEIQITDCGLLGESFKTINPRKNSYLKQKGNSLKIYSIIEITKSTNAIKSARPNKAS